MLWQLDAIEQKSDAHYEIVLKSLTELATGEHGCPKLIILTPPKKEKVPDGTRSPEVWPGALRHALVISWFVERGRPGGQGHGE